MFPNKTFREFLLPKPPTRDSGEQKLFRVEAVSISMPDTARVVVAKNDDQWHPGEIVIHAIVDPTAADVARRFMVFVPGDPLDDPADATFLGVVVLKDDGRAFYVYDLGR